MQRPQPTEARDVGAALDDRLVPGSSVDRWGLVAEGAVPSAVVVVRLPVADHNSGPRKRPEHVDVEAFVAHPAVERLDVTIAPGLAGAGRGRRLHSPVQRPERRPGSSTALRSILPSGSPLRSRTARRAGYRIHQEGSFPTLFASTNSCAILRSKVQAGIER
jgi:hypothetical protein